AGGEADEYLAAPEGPAPDHPAHRCAGKRAESGAGGYGESAGRATVAGSNVGRAIYADRRDSELHADGRQAWADTLSSESEGDGLRGRGLAHDPVAVRGRQRRRLGDLGAECPGRCLDAATASLR